MKVFVSWSGERSRHLAQAVHAWLPTVIQAAEPWMSKSDLNKGARWGVELALELQQTRVGIICLTPDNIHSPWLLFEVGALSKTLPDTFVCPLLCDLEPSDIVGPLAQFQATIAEKEDLRNLARTINAAQENDALPLDRLNKAFELAWPDLQAQLSLVPAVPANERHERSTNEIAREILGILRLQAREAELREDDFYKSRDSYMGFAISLFQTLLQTGSQVFPIWQGTSKSSIGMRLHII